jgi:hypothetical protein
MLIILFSLPGDNLTPLLRQRLKAHISVAAAAFDVSKTPFDEKYSYKFVIIDANIL